MLQRKDGGAVRGKSVGSDLEHWKKYASKNNSLAKGKTGENAGVPLSEPTHKASGAKARGRADRAAYAKGGRIKKAAGGRTPKVIPGIGSRLTGGSDTGVGRAQLTRREPRFR